MKISAILKWITGGLEGIVGIPFLGGLLVLSTMWAPLYILLALHIITLVFSIREKQHVHGSILGIITSCIAWIPFVGMVMHIITAVFLLLDAYKESKQN